MTSPTSQPILSGLIPPGYSNAESIYMTKRSLICRALREKDKQSVVLKTLNSDFPTPSEIARLQHEYQLVKDLQIPGVIRVYDLLQYGGHASIVFEDFGAISLADLIQQGISDLFILLELALQVVQILGTIHGRQVIHKDINPRNILWNAETKEVKLIDFGISTKLSREEQSSDVANMLEGSLPYISPEQAGRMNREVDYRTDYDSLGATLYEVFTGKTPFDAQDPMEIGRAHV